MMKLEGQTALITGATGGIGAAIVKMLHEAGANIVATGTNQEKLDALQCDFKSRLKVLRYDLSKSEESEALFDDAEKIAGADVSILVCNAGFCQDSLAMRMSDEKWHDVINLDLNASFRLNRAAIKKMMRKRYGRIINISSIIGITGNIGQANYAAAKAGMIGMSKSLALEVATRGITVNCIAPGFIDSPMTADLSQEIKHGILQRIPIGAMGRPEDIAAGVLFLASQESSYITGQTLHINGGMLMP